MNENENPIAPSTDEPGFFKCVAKDDGVQRAAAGVVVAAVVAAAKYALFGGTK